MIEEAARETCFWPENLADKVIEECESQITYLGLGWLVTPKDKYPWDPDGVKRIAIHSLVLSKIPELEIRIGGTTSIGVTRKGIDKAYGMHKLIDMLSITKEDILFFGDRLNEGGNYYPVKAFGIETAEFSNWQDTAKKLEVILANS